MALSDNLIAYWSLDEASGDAIDAHGSNDLTDNNTVGATTGLISGARQFDGSTEYFSHATNSDLEMGDIGFTICGWVKLNTGAILCALLSKDSNAANSRDYNLGINGDPMFHCGTSAGFAIARPGGSVSTGVWHFLVGWHDPVADTVNVQLDNGSVTSASTSGGVPDVSSCAVMIGRRVYSGYEDYLAGCADEIGIWKRVLTSDERTELYNSGSGRDYTYITGGGGGSVIPVFMNQYRQRVA